MIRMIRVKSKQVMIEGAIMLLLQGCAGTIQTKETKQETSGKPVIQTQEIQEQSSGGIDTGKKAEGYTVETLEFGWVSDFWNGYGVLEVDGKYGLIHEDGSIALDPIYDSVGVFDTDGNYAPVKLGDDYYYVDQQGTTTLTLDQNYSNLGIFSEGAAAVMQNGMYGYMDLELKHSDFIWEYLGAMCNGMAAAKMNGKYGLIDNRLSDLTGYIYDDIAVNDFGVCSAMNTVLAKDSEKWRLIGENGSYVTNAIYEDARPFYDGYCAVKKDGKWGFVTFLGSELNKFIYEDAFSFCNGFAPVKFNGLWGVVDTQLEWVIMPTFDNVITINASGYMAVERNKELLWIHINNSTVE